MSHWNERAVSLRPSVGDLSMRNGGAVHNKSPLTAGVCTCEMAPHRSYRPFAKRASGSTNTSPMTSSGSGQSARCKRWQPCGGRWPAWVGNDSWRAWAATMQGLVRARRDHIAPGNRSLRRPKARCCTVVHHSDSQLELPEGRFWAEVDLALAVIREDDIFPSSHQD